MSDRGRVTQGAQIAPEGHSTLEDLSASRDLHKNKRSELTAEAANQSDLTSASLSSANVMRVPHRPDGRRSISSKIGSELSPSPDSSRSTTTSAKPERGILTNPTYKYSGGFASKIISFIANILKFIERLILRLLTGPDRSTASLSQQNRSVIPAQKEANDPDLSKQEREKRDRAQTIARS